jgi:hypothetical protein|tara:strand:+ start:962 stop:1555 length:594 start_codon:yes stop_codon:yes gene_type:complete
LSYRIEEKIPLSRSDGIQMLKLLVNTGFKELYPERVIRSTYFDTNNFRIFSDSEEGVLPRKKIRIRCYPEDISGHNLEIKISSIEGRFKTVKKLLDDEALSINSAGYFDNLYGPVRPVCIVKYSRKYFIKDRVRLTFDQNIIYEDYNSCILKIPENKCVIEIKAPIEDDRDRINSIINYPRARFSKFSEAIKSLELC